MSCVIDGKQSRLTHPRSPVNFDVPVGLQPYSESFTLQEPHPGPLCSLAQHVLINLAEIRDRLQNSRDGSSGIVSTVIMVVYVSHCVESSTNELGIICIGKHTARLGGRPRWG